MLPRLTDGTAPYLRPFRIWVSTDLGYTLSVQTLLLMKALCLADDGDAFWHASELKAVHWQQDAVQVGVN